MSPLIGEEEIDIWKNKKKQNLNEEDQQTLIQDQERFPQKIEKEKDKDVNNVIKIENNSIEENKKVEIFGVYDPAEYNFNLNMVGNKCRRYKVYNFSIKKIKLSNTSNEILENILLSFSFPPDGMETSEFAKIKIDWLIENNRTELIENFLKQNKDFNGKKKAVQYLVDQSISQANIKEGCNKLSLLIALSKMLI